MSRWARWRWSSVAMVQGRAIFVDILRFTADALHPSLDRALRERGGFGEVCRRAAVPVVHFGIRLDFLLTDALAAGMRSPSADEPTGAT